MGGRDRMKWWEGRDQSERCEALLLDSYGHHTSNRCHHFCSVAISDGKVRRLCLKHAQMVAMANAFAGSTARPIERTRLKVALQTKVEFFKE